MLNLHSVLCGDGADFCRQCAVGTPAYFDCDVTAQQRKDQATDTESNHDGLPQYETADDVEILQQ